MDRIGWGHGLRPERSFVCRGAVGTVAYIPLCRPDLPASVGFVESIEPEADLAYERMRFRSTFPGLTILPGGLTVWLEGAQDRAVARAHVFSRSVVAPTFCIEPGEPGRWHRGRPWRFGMLPPGLRWHAAAARGPIRADRLWGSLRAFAQRAGVQAPPLAPAPSLRALMDADHVRCSMPDFRVPETLLDQRGVLVLINGRPIGLEIAPSAWQFRFWWNAGGLNEAYAVEAARWLVRLPLLPSPGCPLEEIVARWPLRRRPQDAGESSEGRWAIEAVEWGPLRGEAVWVNGELAYASLVAGSE